MSTDETRDLKDEMHRLNQNVNGLNENMTRILSYIESDPRVKREGLFEKAERMDATLDALESREKVYLAKVSILSIVVTALLNVFWFFLSKIFK